MTACEEARAALEAVRPLAVSAAAGDLIAREDALEALAPLLHRLEEDLALARMATLAAEHAAGTERAAVALLRRELRIDPPPTRRRWVLW